MTNSKILEPEDFDSNGWYKHNDLIDPSLEVVIPRYTTLPKTIKFNNINILSLVIQTVQIIYCENLTLDTLLANKYSILIKANDVTINDFFESANVHINCSDFRSYKTISFKSLKCNNANVFRLTLKKLTCNVCYASDLFVKSFRVNTIECDLLKFSKNSYASRIFCRFLSQLNHGPYHTLFCDDELNITYIDSSRLTIISNIFYGFNYDCKHIIANKFFTLPDGHNTKITITRDKYNE